MARRIAAPVAAADDSTKKIAATFDEIMFDEKHCGVRLGIAESFPDFRGMHVPRSYLKTTSDRLDAIALFVLNEEIPLQKAQELFPRADLDAMCAMSLIPLDLGTGSGIHAIMASRHSDHAVGIDISPRAVAFSKFNQRLNDRNNLEFLQGDLYAPVAGLQFDLITANPPYNPTPFVHAGANFWSGGSSGEDLLIRIIRGLDEHLTDNGICHIITLLCHSKQGPAYREKLDSWLEGGLSRYDVMVQAMPYDGYFQYVDSEAHGAFLKEYFSKSEFGVIGLCKSLGKSGFYYHGLPFSLPPFFDENCRFRRTVGHQAFDACRAEMLTSSKA